MIKFIISQTIKGKTVNRILMNYTLKNIEAKGRILDLGGGNKRSSYFEHISIDKDPNIISLDISKERSPDIIADLEKNLSIENESFDSVLCINLLEHIYNHKRLLNEVSRVLKREGQLIGYVPFLVKFHPDPNDYFRYTSQALERLLNEAGFYNVSVRFVGVGPLTAAWSQMEFFLPYFIRWIVTIPVIYLDRLVIRIKPFLKNKLALGYVFVAKK